MALAALAPRLAELGHSAEAVEAARAIEDKWSRSEALAALAPHLTEPLLREALEATRAIGGEWSWSRRLAALAPHLAGAGHPAEALEAARAIEEEWPRSEALAALAPHLGPTERDRALREALEAARAIGDEGSRSAALAALAPPWPTERDPALCEALEAARAIGDEGSRSKALAALAPRLVELGHPAEALEAARAIESEWPRSWALAALAPHLTEPLLREAVEAARVIGNEGSGPRRWAGWPPTWGRPSGTEPSARRWRRRGPSGTRGPVPALAALAPHLGPTERDRALRDALEAARANGDGRPGPRWPRWPRAWRS